MLGAGNVSKSNTSFLVLYMHFVNTEKYEKWRTALLSDARDYYILLVNSLCIL